VYRVVKNSMQKSAEFQLVDMFPITDRRQKPVDMFLANRQWSVDRFPLTGAGMN